MCAHVCVSFLSQYTLRSCGSLLFPCLPLFVIVYLSVCCYSLQIYFVCVFPSAFILSMHVCLCVCVCVLVTFWYTVNYFPHWAVRAAVWFRYAWLQSHQHNSQTGTFHSVQHYLEAVKKQNNSNLQSAPSLVEVSSTQKTETLYMFWRLELVFLDYSQQYSNMFKLLQVFLNT